jgi:hypothetical protein
VALHAHKGEFYEINVDLVSYTPALALRVAFDQFCCLYNLGTLDFKKSLKFVKDGLSCTFDRNLFLVSYCIREKRIVEMHSSCFDFLDRIGLSGIISLWDR